MLDSIRKQSKSLFVLLILGAIIVVFIFWGIGPTGDGGGAGDVVATVNGAKIGAKDYLGFHKRQIDFYRETYKDRFTDEMARSLDFKHQTLNIMINRALALQAADDAGLDVSAEEVQRTIAGMPVFQKDGVFNEEQYFKTLSANRIMPKDFEESINSDLKADKIRERVTGAVSVTEEDVRKAYFEEFRMVDLAYMEVSPKRFSKKVTVADEEARAYLDANSSDFAVPARVRAFYAYAPYEFFASKARVTDEDIKGHYEANKARFSRPGEVKASHILIRPESGIKDKAAAEAEAQKRAEEALELVKRGEDFGALAIKLSQDPGSASKGGDLGWFERGIMIKPFEDAAFSMEVGSISGVVRSEFGYHIIKVEGRKEPEPRPLSEVTGKIEKELKRRKGEDTARETMETLRRELEEAEDLKALRRAAASHKWIKFESTGLFAEHAPQKAFAASEKLLDTIFVMQEGRTSNVVVTSKGLYLIKLLERVEPHVPEFGEVSADVEKRLRREKSTEAAKGAAEKFLERVLGGEGLGYLAAKEGYKVQKTGYFSRTRGVVPGINALAAEYPDLFKLHKDSPYLQKIIASGGKFYLVEWKGTREAEEKGLEVVKEAMEASLLAARKEEAVVNWLEGLRSKAKIRVYEERL